MSPIEILFPAFAMFFLTMACVFLLGFARYRAISAGQVKISFFRTYDKGSQPERLHLLSRHVQNHFEVPPLFYIGVVISYATNTDLLITVIFAWLFVGARVVHSIIHLGRNNVSYRFSSFIFSLLCLLGLWCSILYGLLQA
jgi:hypothetical protein